jgi:CobQ/CobB/MinD/ParA nucleotide binding domain
MTNIHLIGGEKGGVGKSVVARVLAQYMIDKNIPFVGFDTDRSHSSLLRFYSDFASPMLIDSYESLDTMVELAAENRDERILVDLAAQTHERLVKWMDESGVLEALNDHGLSLAYWHVMDSGKDSVSLLKNLFDRFGSRLNYVLVLNQLRGDNFDLFEKSVEKAQADGLRAKIVSLKRLNQDAIARIDSENSSFWAAQQRTPENRKGLGILQRQRVKVWLQHAYGEIDRVGI